MEKPGHKAGWCCHCQAPPRPKSFQTSSEPHICKAGVNIREKFAGIKFQHRPCYLDDAKPKPGAVTCEHLRLPTKEEIAEREAWAKERMGLLATVLTGILPWREKHKGENFAEIVECPACKGKLHLSISGRSHVHGKCETEGCVQWLE